MRKITFILLILYVPFLCQAQSAFQKKDILISGGLAIGNYRTLTYPASERAGKALPLYVAAEYGVNSLAGVGPFAGYYSREYKFIGNQPAVVSDDFTYSSRYTVVGIRGTYHFNPSLERSLKTELNSTDLDLYLSVLLGYEFNRLSDIRGINIEDKSRPVAGVVAGARYYLNHRVALYGEAGPGIFGLTSIGLTVRL